MDNTDKKIFTMFYIDEHDLPPEEKLALMEWVKDANMDQVNHLLATGEITDNPTITEASSIQDWDIWQKGWEDGIGAGIPEGMARGIAASVFAAGIATVAYKVYKRFLSKAARSCKDYAGVKKINCMSKYKKKAQQEKIKFLQKGLAKCSSNKTPDKCKDKLQSKIRKEKAKMGQL